MSKAIIVLTWHDAGTCMTRRLVRWIEDYSAKNIKTRYTIEWKDSDAMGGDRWMHDRDVYPGQDWDREEPAESRQSRLLIAALVERDVRRSRRRKVRKR